ncbi:hypothetical protein ACFLWZ_04015, partial [Chloroflexota bacterium]
GEQLYKYNPTTGSYQWTLSNWKREIEAMRENVKKGKPMMPVNLRLGNKLAPVIADMSWDVTLKS